MPLRAFIANKEIISTFLSPSEWEELKQSVKKNSLEVTIALTNKKGFLRTSKKGLQHFVHKKGELPEDWKPESAQHLYVKSKILLGCKKSGWDAISEYSENNWIADILATKGKGRIAFEAQWSPQTYEKTKERQNKYNIAKVRGCWLFKNPPKELRDYNGFPRAINDIPVFQLRETKEKDIKVEFNNRLFEIDDFVSILLDGKIKFCNKLSAINTQAITINFYEKTCWKCGTTQHSYYLSDSIKSACGQDIHLDSPMWEDDDLEFNPQITKTIADFTKTEEGKFLKIGYIKNRYSNTIHNTYKSFGCYRCDAIFGDWYNHEEVLEAKMEGPISSINVNIDLSMMQEEKEHWCFSENRQFCE
nr:hypothetical protein [uncultured Draconibacterium sp.]